LIHERRRPDARWPCATASTINQAWLAEPGGTRERLASGHPLPAPSVPTANLRHVPFGEPAKAATVSATWIRRQTMPTRKRFIHARAPRAANGRSPASCAPAPARPLNTSCFHPVAERWWRGGRPRSGPGPAGSRPFRLRSASLAEVGGPFGGYCAPELSGDAGALFH